jgi:acyl-CoA synthetase (AMP-forming)/AMP-acid ligase II
MAPPGGRLLLNHIDQVALHSPELVFVETARSADINEGLQRVTFRDLLRGIDRCAQWIDHKLGKGHDFPALAYFGPHDLRYVFLVFGACKAGYKVNLTFGILSARILLM